SALCSLLSALCSLLSALCSLDFGIDQSRALQFLTVVIRPLKKRLCAERVAKPDFRNILSG
ncbi:hypothetical protein, partial [Bartonella apis]